MIARTVNFASRENQIIDWYMTVPETLYVSERDYSALSYKEDLEKLLKQVDILIDKYPDALNEGTILRKARILTEYAKENNHTLSTCYSYYNEEKSDLKIRSDVRKQSYGIRILPTNFDEINKCITVTGYDATSSGIILSKSELKLKLNKNRLDYFNMTYMDNCYMNFALGNETLTYLEPRILTKHL